MKKAQIILVLCGAAIIGIAIAFVAITDIFFSSLLAKVVITAALLCIEAALVLHVIERFRENRLPLVTIGVAIGVLIVMIQGIVQ